MDFNVTFKRSNGNVLHRECRAPELVLDLVLDPTLLGFLFLVASMMTWVVWFLCIFYLRSSAAVWEGWWALSLWNKKVTINKSIPSMPYIYWTQKISCCNNPDEWMISLWGSWHFGHIWLTECYGHCSRGCIFRMNLPCNLLALKLDWNTQRSLYGLSGLCQF